MKKFILFVCSAVLFNATGLSQDQHLIDSLQTKLKQLEAERTELRNGVISLRDTTAIKIFVLLSYEFVDNQPDKAWDFAQKVVTLSKQIGFMRGAGNGYTILAEVLDLRGNYPEALKTYSIAIKMYEKAANKYGIMNCYSQIAGIYTAQGNYPEALKNQFISLKLSEEIQAKDGISMNLNGLGIIYGELGNLPEALKNYSAALKIAEEMGDKGKSAQMLINIGTIYDLQGNSHEALEKYDAAIKLLESTGKKRTLSHAYENMAIVYARQNKYDEALKNFTISSKLKEEMGDTEGLATCYSNMGALYFSSNRIRDARNWLQKSLTIATEIGALDLLYATYNNLASADSALGDYKNAFENYKWSVFYRDSVNNNANTKKITEQQMQYEFDKKQALAKAEQEKKDALAVEEIENQKLVRNGFVGGFATVLIFAGTFFRQRNKIKKEKKRSDALLLNILPDEIAEELKETGGSKAKSHAMVSVMFTDFKDFTKISETISAEMLVDELHTCFSAFDTILQKHNIEKIKTIGDAYMCVSGLPVSNPNHATDMVKAGREIMDYVNARKKEKETKGDFAFELRIGINSGPVVAGIVGLKKFSYDIWGDTVNTAARMENESESGKINISGTTYELIKDTFSCTHRGKITAKNKGEIDIYFVN